MPNSSASMLSTIYLYPIQLIRFTAFEVSLIVGERYGSVLMGNPFSNEFFPL
jgi:hypothetical protein